MLKFLFHSQIYFSFSNLLFLQETTFRKVVHATMVRDKQHGPVLELNRIQVKRSRGKGGLAGPDGVKSVFGQMSQQICVFTPDSLMLPHRIWKVKFVGEWSLTSILQNPIRELEPTYI